MNFRLPRAFNPCSRIKGSEAATATFFRQTRFP
jgi:hypothetical protein